MASLYSIKFLLAFCSIVYELLLAQALSAFLENTVFRFSVTIGLYLFSLGLGSWQSGRCSAKGYAAAVIALMRVEVLLTLLGGAGILSVYALGTAGVPREVFSFVCHALILAVGFTTGFELPLCIEIARSRRAAPENALLAADYAGALFGPLVFAFYFFPHAGLFRSCLVTAGLNAGCGIFLWHLYTKMVPDSGRLPRLVAVIQAVLLIALVTAFARADAIENFLTMRYLG